MSQDRGQWRTLPVGDRLDETPECPIPDASAAELDMWASYWRKPQSLIWLENRQEIEVGLHVRSLVEAFKAGAPANARTLVRQQMDALLLTHKAMTDAMVCIGVVGASESGATSAAASRPSSRERRLNSVPNVGA